MDEVIITVRGTSEMRVAAELAVVRVTAAVDGADRADTVGRAAALAEPICTDLAARGDAGDLDSWSSDRVAVWSDRPWNERGEQLPLVHHASIEITATFVDVDVLSAWLDDLASVDGVHIASAEWLLTPATRLRAEDSAAQAAVADAVRRAAAYAAALGRSAVDAVEVADSGLLAGEPGLQPEASRAMSVPAMDAARAPGFALRPGEIVVSAAVDARFRAR